MIFDIGDGVRFGSTFTDLSDTNTDPTTVIVKIQDPSGDVETLEYGVDADVIKSATGIYYVDRTIDEAGVWWQRWTGAGALIVAQEDSILVQAQQVT